MKNYAFLQKSMTN